MAKKADLLAEAKKLKLEVTSKNTIAEIETAINDAGEKAKKLEKKQSKKEELKSKVAKSGKRSVKGVKESEEKADKQERKSHVSGTIEAEKASKPKVIPKTRSRLERSSKKIREATKLIDKTKEYSLKEALELATKTSISKFDGTVELHIRLNVDPKQADQNIREVLVLPAGSGKTVRIAVFAEADDVTVAKKAGADIAGTEEFLQQLEKGIIDFDILIATPTVMQKLAKHARVLGPKGLMPNPKSGTVTKDVATAIAQARAGKVEIRVDEAGIVHLGIGKVSFGADRLMQNAEAIFTSVKSAKPASLKGTYINTIFVTTTMGPSIKISASEL